MGNKGFRSYHVDNNGAVYIYDKGEATKDVSSLGISYPFEVVARCRSYAYISYPAPYAGTFYNYHTLSVGLGAVSGSVKIDNKTVAGTYTGYSDPYFTVNASIATPEEASISAIYDYKDWYWMKIEFYEDESKTKVLAKGYFSNDTSETEPTWDVITSELEVGGALGNETIQEITIQNVCAHEEYLKSIFEVDEIIVRQLS